VTLLSIQEHLADPSHGHLPSVLLIDNPLPVPPPLSADVQWLDGPLGLAWWFRYRFHTDKPRHMLAEFLQKAELTEFVRGNYGRSYGSCLYDWSPVLLGRWLSAGFVLS
jgi:hypothetical protein